MFHMEQSHLLIEAREICATVAEAGTVIERRMASSYREGMYDDDREIQIALAALRRGAVLATRPRPANYRANRIKGALARAASLSPERRSEIARTAAKARWGER